jgi:hypothetical protein
VVIGSFLMNALVAKRLFGYGPVAQLKDISGVVAASTFMAACLIGLRALLDLPPVLEAAALIPAGVAAYLAFSLIFRVSAVTDALPIMAQLGAPVLRKLRRRTP